MKAWKLAACAAVLAPCIAPGAALAEDPTSPPTPWFGDASLGYIRTTGNTNSTAFNAKGDVEWKAAPWDNQFKAQAAYGSSAGTSTAETYSFGDKLSHDLSPDDYVFVSLDYLNDRFAGVASTWSEAVGYGRHFVKTERQTLDVDVGAGASQLRDAEATDYQNQLIGVFNLNYLLKISPVAQFKQTLHVTSGRQDTFINPVAELKFNIVGNFIATLAYDWRHNTSVPPGNVRTDTITTINFGYTFGKKPT
jgi:putative salt-induced outer membrane protein